jgi:SulP family sulfate permease
MLPKSFIILKSRKENQLLTKERCVKDSIAGLIVGIIALPLSVALAISSGVTPEVGLITAIVAGLCISLFGGSSVQIGGPTGAFVVIVYGIIQQHGLSGLILATFMAGILLVILGVLKMGTLIQYVPKTVVVGFTSGIGVTLLTTQIKDFLGLQIHQVPSEFSYKIVSYVQHFETLSLQTFLIGILTIVVIRQTSKFSKLIPGSLCAIFITTLLAHLIKMDVATIGTTFGEISGTIPLPQLPSLGAGKFIELLVPALTIAFLAGVESLLSAVVADDMLESDEKHDSNMELIGQGIANIASALFGGIPATGAIARTAANIKNGGRTPLSGIVHAMTLLMIMLVLMPLIQLIPLATLSGVLVIVSFNMIEIKKMKELVKESKTSMIITLITFTFTVVFDLVVAVVVAMLLHTTFLLFERAKLKQEKVEEVEI